MLHVRSARHWHAHILFSLPCCGVSESRDRLLDFESGILHVHTELSSNHFVAAASRMQFRSERPKFFDKRAFDEVVHILRLRSVEPGRFGFCTALDFVKGTDDSCAFFIAENSGLGNRAGPCTVERKLLRQQATVELPRTLKLIEGRVRPALEAPAPHLLLFFLFASAAHPASALRRISVSCGTVIGSANRLMKPSASFGL